MARLYRPHIPIAIKVQVAEHQAAAKPNEGWRFYQAAGWNPDRHHGKRLAVLLQVLADQFGCAVGDLRLDHDPPLGARPKHRRGLSPKWFYTPDANDPDHLFYRPHGAQFDGSHDVKTRIRGDHGQFSDITLIKRERRRERKAADAKDLKKKRPKWRSARKAKYRWPKRSFGRKAK